ncbi:hypothetical protein [Paenibacillus sp. FSL R10-2734]|uniref:hypothetical protein n=1 Tax=Paenibacillus sp. FSL R10-2734 TaxID=2954691 RepID=UPI0030D79949
MNKKWEWLTILSTDVTLDAAEIAHRPLHLTHFETQSLSGLLSSCLRLTIEITFSRPRLDIVAWF